MNIELKKYRPAINSEIEEAEKLLGYKLPAEYISFLLEFNAAIPEDNVFDEDLTVSVDRFIPVSEIATRAKKVDGLPEGAIPIAEATSGNLIYFKKASEEVMFWDHEIDNDKKLASSFDEFLIKLLPFDMKSVQLKPEQVKSVWVDPNFNPEFD